MANPYFEMAEGAEAGKRLEMPDGAVEVVVGRGVDCQIVIQSAAVSRRHARLRRELDRVVVEDLGSSNGTFVNGERVEETVVLKDGDQVSFGSVSTTFVMPTPPPADVGATIPLSGPGATVLVAKTSITTTTARHEPAARPASPPPPKAEPPPATPPPPPPPVTRTDTPTVPTPAPSPAAPGAAASPGLLELAAIALGSFLSVFGIGLAVLFYLR